MKKRVLGRTGLKVSELCLGTQSFGWKTDQETSNALLDRFHASGGNFIQASAVCPDFPLLAGWTGQSESHVGRWMVDRRVRRSDLVIATRLTICRSMPHSRSIARTVRAACEGSLRRLGTSHLDLLVVEWSDGLVPIEEVFGTVALLVRAGMLRYGVVSGFPGWRVADLIGLSKRSSIARPEALQIDYSLLNRGAAELEARDMAREYRLGLLARAPLARGALVHRPQSAKTAPEAGNPARLLDALYFVARERGVSSAQVALAWVLATPEITSAVLAPRLPEHLEEAVAATHLDLSAADLATLDDVSLPPAPLSPPEAHAASAFSCSPVSLLSAGCLRTHTSNN